MEPSYSVLAEVLSKFQTAPVLIQALWIIAGAACVLTALHTVRAIAVAALRRMRNPEIELVYGIVRDRTGRLMIYPELKGGSRENASPLPSLQNWRDRVSQG